MVYAPRDISQAPPYVHPLLLKSPLVAAAFSALRNGHPPPADLLSASSSAPPTPPPSPPPPAARAPTDAECGLAPARDDALAAVEPPLLPLARALAARRPVAVVSGYARAELARALAHAANVRRADGAARAILVIARTDACAAVWRDQMLDVVDEVHVMVFAAAKKKRQACLDKLAHCQFPGVLIATEKAVRDVADPAGWQGLRDALRQNRLVKNWELVVSETTGGDPSLSLEYSPLRMVADAQASAGVVVVCNDEKKGRRAYTKQGVADFAMQHLASSRFVQRDDCDADTIWLTRAGLEAKRIENASPQRTSRELIDDKDNKLAAELAETDTATPAPETANTSRSARRAASRQNKSEPEADKQKQRASPKKRKRRTSGSARRQPALKDATAGRDDSPLLQNQAEQIMHDVRPSGRLCRSARSFGETELENDEERCVTMPLSSSPADTPKDATRNTESATKPVCGRTIASCSPEEPDENFVSPLSQLRESSAGRPSLSPSTELFLSPRSSFSPSPELAAKPWQRDYDQQATRALPSSKKKTECIPFTGADGAPDGDPRKRPTKKTTKGTVRRSSSTGKTQLAAAKQETNTREMQQVLDVADTSKPEPGLDGVSASLSRSTQSGSQKRTSRKSRTRSSSGSHGNDVYRRNAAVCKLKNSRASLPAGEKSSADANKKLHKGVRRSKSWQLGVAGFGEGSSTGGVPRSRSELGSDVGMSPNHRNTVGRTGVRRASKKGRTPPSRNVVTPRSANSRVPVVEGSASKKVITEVVDLTVDSSDDSPVRRAPPKAQGRNSRQRRRNGPTRRTPLDPSGVWVVEDDQSQRITRPLAELSNTLLPRTTGSSHHLSKAETSAGPSRKNKSRKGRTADQPSLFFAATKKFSPLVDAIPAAKKREFNRYKRMATEAEKKGKAFHKEALEYYLECLNIYDQDSRISSKVLALSAATGTLKTSDFHSPGKPKSPIRKGGTRPRRRALARRNKTGAESSPIYISDSE